MPLSALSLAGWRNNGIKRRSAMLMADRWKPEVINWPILVSCSRGGPWRHFVGLRCG
jgi:hypothetical protein